MARMLMIGLALFKCDVWLLWQSHQDYRQLVVRDDSGQIVFIAAAFGSAVVKIFWDDLP